MKVSIYSKGVWIDGYCVAYIDNNGLGFCPYQIRIINNSAFHAKVLIWEETNEIIAVLDTRENRFYKPEKFKEKYNLSFGMGLTYKITEVHIIKSLD